MSGIWNEHIIYWPLEEINKVQSLVNSWTYVNSRIGISHCCGGAADLSIYLYLSHNSELIEAQPGPMEGFHFCFSKLVAHPGMGLLLVPVLSSCLLGKPRFLSIILSCWLCLQRSSKGWDCFLSGPIRACGIWTSEQLGNENPGGTFHHTSLEECVLSRRAAAALERLSNTSSISNKLWRAVKGGKWCVLVN